jgi:hypothetical protein
MMANEDDARSVILSMEQEPGPQRRVESTVVVDEGATA